MIEEYKFYADTTLKKNGHKNHGGGIWEVSNLGNVKKNGELYELKTNRIYPSFGRWFVHKAVAELFIPNPENKKRVDHIDTNILNNKVDNLRWVTDKENMNNPLTIQHLKTAKKGRVISEETRRKLSESQKGRPMSESHKANFLIAMSKRRGQDTWMKGKKHSEESKRLISEHNWSNKTDEISIKKKAEAQRKRVETHLSKHWHWKLVNGKHEYFQ